MLGFFKTSKSLLKQAGGAKPKPKVAPKVDDKPKKAEKKQKLGTDGKPLPPKPKAPNFFDLAFKFIDFGIGKKFRRALWDNPNNYWTVTRVKITNLTSNRKRGSAWGILTWRGITDIKERKITGVLKREWRFAKPDPNYIAPNKPQPVGW